jgi:hypothetical protein
MSGVWRVVSGRAVSPANLGGEPLCRLRFLRVDSRRLPGLIQRLELTPVTLRILSRWVHWQLMGGSREPPARKPKDQATYKAAPFQGGQAIPRARRPIAQAARPRAYPPNPQCPKRQADLYQLAKSTFGTNLQSNIRTRFNSHPRFGSSLFHE